LGGFFDARKSVGLIERVQIYFKHQHRLRSIRHAPHFRA